MLPIVRLYPLTVRCSVVNQGSLDKIAELGPSLPRPVAVGGYQVRWQPQRDFLPSLGRERRRAWGPPTSSPEELRGGPFFGLAWAG